MLARAKVLCERYGHTSGLACRALTRSWENRTGVSLFMGVRAAQQSQWLEA